MADAKRTIDLVFNGVDKTGAATAAALGNTQKFASSLQGATQPIADFTTSALKLEAGLLATGAAITAFAVKTAGDFDSAFREISTLIDAPIDSINEFRQAILDYASTSTKPLEDVTQSIYTAISAGVDFGDSIGAISQAEKLAVASKAELSDSLLVIVSSLNAYGLEIDQAERFSDALFSTVKNGQTTLPELAASLSQVSGIAATTGVDFEELLAAIATLTSTGTPTAQAVTQIRGALSNILKPTAEASALAKELGLNFSLQRLESVGLAGVLQDVQEATGGSAEQMGKLFGSVQGLNAVLTLTGLGADTFASNISEIGNSAGATEAAFEKMAGSIGNSTQLVKNSIQGVLIAIGTPLLDEFGGVASAIASIFQALGQSANTGNLGELVAFIEGQFASLEETLTAVAQNIPAALEAADLSGFANGLQAVSTAFGSLFGGVDLRTVDGLSTAITSVARGFELLSQFSAGAVESFGPLFRQLTDIGGTLLQISPELAKAAGEFGGFATQANILSGALVSILPSIEALVGIIALNQGASLVGALGAATKSLAGAGGLIALLGKGGLAGVAGAAGFGVGTLANNLSEFATGTSASTFLTDFAISLGLIDDEATRLADSLNDVSFAGTGISAEEAGRQIKAADAEMARLAGTADNSATKVFNFSTGLMEAADAAESNAEFFREGVGVLLDYDTGLEMVVNSSKDLAKAGIESAGTFSVISDEADKATKSFLDLSSAGAEIQLEFAIARLESQTAISTANIEADAQKTVAAFKSIDNSVGSTGESLTKLFGLLGDDNIRKFDKLDIRSQIEAEESRRQSTFDLQKRLTEQQIRINAERLKSLRGGQGLITINGDGLAPHLEAFMYEILEAIQVRANQDGFELLLGAGS